MYYMTWVSKSLPESDYILQDITKYGSQCELFETACVALPTIYHNCWTLGTTLQHKTLPTHFRDLMQAIKENFEKLPQSGDFRDRGVCRSYNQYRNAKLWGNTGKSTCPSHPRANGSEHILERPRNWKDLGSKRICTHFGKTWSISLWVGLFENLYIGNLYFMK